MEADPCWKPSPLQEFLLTSGPVGMTRDKEGKIYTMKDVNRGSVYDGPLILLINGFTASASEMLAGTLAGLSPGTDCWLTQFWEGNRPDCTAPGYTFRRTTYGKNENS